MPLLHPVLIADPTRIADPFVPTSCLSDEPGLIDLATLCELTAAVSATPEVWRPVIRHRPDRRWYTRLLLSATVEVWLRLVPGAADGGTRSWRRAGCADGR
ncbi:hypothetical protein [Frankia sp. CcWB2]